jgi:hypothetical protein
MAPLMQKLKALWARRPRASGDGPHPLPVLPGIDEAAPRERGWPPFAFGASETHLGGPARAGMAP